MLNALTIDVEDYYHVSALKQSCPLRTGNAMKVASKRIRIVSWTFWMHTRQKPLSLCWAGSWNDVQLIRTLVARGHEVASHGRASARLHRREQFRTETQRSKRLLEDTLGQPIRGYRAASYSITVQSLWALDVLREEGFVYDSSIFPIRHDLYAFRVTHGFAI